MSIQPLGSGLAPTSASFAQLSESNGLRQLAPGNNAANSSANGTDQTSTANATQQPPSAQQLKEAVKSANEFVGSINSSLQFSVDDKTGQTVVKVMDSETKEVIKQIPSQEMLDIAQALDKLKGLLVQQKA
jgi:flagellar protein FlaG